MKKVPFGSFFKSVTKTIEIYVICYIIVKNCIFNEKR
ncbi:hypothetical protein BCE_1364 [Bacillus cereus ATCC 10987]|uniref:Uncharacterized protein n=1 Tax=Bacillus cereus (strain ATCC 10987 / NRS 248) TaxID=222523 RepID=Q73BQ4_BACC1|nr:hypothetical protein BCE_1364 [Bacillus cereus ATCC 10987]